MQFQDRDGRILWTIFENDGVLAKRQVKALFWPHATWRAMEKRLAKLCTLDYLAWPNPDQRKLHPIPEPVCWLDWRGAQWVADSFGLKIPPPRKLNENQLRAFQKSLKKCGVRWVREPRWSMLVHDLAVVDFRIFLERSLHQLPHFTLVHWIPESDFRADPDVISFSAEYRDGRTVRRKKGVIPDAFFEIVDERRRSQCLPHRARFLLEMDCGTHDNPSFGREKVIPGVAYIRSQVYKERFGYNGGHWLVVINGGERRMRNLMQQTEEKLHKDAHLFLFTQLDQIFCQNILSDKIWWCVGLEHPTAMLT